MNITYNIATSQLIADTYALPQNSAPCEYLFVTLDTPAGDNMMLIEFRCPKGAKFVSALVDIPPTHVAQYKIPAILTKNIGEVFCQISLRDKVSGKETAKSLATTSPIFVVEQSINATDLIPDPVKVDLINDITLSVAQMNTLRETVLTEKNSGAYNGAKGDKGDKGESVSPLTFYPIGSIYQSVADTSPKVLFGGEWERFGNGQLLVGVDENNANFTPARKVGAFTHRHNEQLAIANYYGKGEEAFFRSDNAWYYSPGPLTRTSLALNCLSTGDNSLPSYTHIAIYRWLRIA